MALSTLSLILYAAQMVSMPCDRVFVETAKSANRLSQAPKEQLMLQEFAEAACKTSNPDALWLIAQQETGFRFNIVRINGENPKILAGQEALTYLGNLKSPSQADAPNVDIGVMQFNWMWHKKGFHSDPMQILSPAQQVNYFTSTFGNEIYRRCSERWVGCFHNQGDRELAKRYQNEVSDKERVLASRALRFIREHRLSLSKQERSLLPRMNRRDFYKAIDSTQQFSLPIKGKDDLAQQSVEARLNGQTMRSGASLSNSGPRILTTKNI